MSVVFDCIVAASEENGIGSAGVLPWRFPTDMAYFRRITTTTTVSGARNAVIMGRKTWESIPDHVRPLPGRINVVLSRSPTLREGGAVPKDVVCAHSLEAALEYLRQRQVKGDATDATNATGEAVASIFVIGGAAVYREALQSSCCRAVYMTRIHHHYDCDTFFPSLSALGFNRARAIEAHVENDVCLEMMCIERGNPVTTDGRLLRQRHEEYQYLDLIRDILRSGESRVDRTGTGTLSCFGVRMRFSLDNNVMPLLTTKRVFWRGVAEELLWFISGSTNANVLRAKGIPIWDGNGSREYLDSIGLTEREEMDLGPVYGFQWRHFGAQYTDMHADYRGQGVDQLSRLIETIKTCPTDRRLVLSAWNPAALSQMALPPCHMFCQFYVSEGQRLSCQMYQRSADMGLGVPFNIASYALLTRLIAHVCDLEAHELIHVIGDAHIYTNHVDAVREQIERQPRPFPTLAINAQKKDIDTFVFDDLVLSDYRPHRKIKMSMAV